MRVHFKFRNVESSEGVKNYAEEKLSRMQKYVRAPLEADVTVSLARRLHCVDVTLRADGERFAGKVESEDMYASIDLVCDKLDRQLRDAKAAATDRMRHSGGVAQLSGKFGPPPEQT
ncbi:MAG: ribosome hibernation-promoting factor, HPF/YfiA family [Sandaracinaceae bacterium]